MSVPFSHAFKQGPCIGALFNMAAGSLSSRGGEPPKTPGEVVSQVIPARNAKLLADYVNWCGGSQKAWEGRIPPHFFPQWAFPLLGQCMKGLPWPATKVMNQGCRIEAGRPLPADQPLEVRAFLSDIRVEEHRARVATKIVCGPADEPEALIAEMYAVVPLAKRTGGKKREKPVVPESHQLLRKVDLSGRAGLDFALLTGDFNPIHWLSPYAKVAGFRSTILHGFGSLGLTYEALINHRLGGNPDRLKWIDVRFVRPLCLPAEVGIYASEEPNDDGAIEIALGAGPGEEAAMLGTAGLAPE